MARVVRSRLVIGGVEYPHRNLKVGQELAGDMPEAVAATGSFPQTEGSVQIWVGPSVSSRAPSPFSGYGGTVPADGTPVVAYVDAGDGLGEQIVFRGKIDSTSGKASEGWVDVELIDTIDQMRATFSSAGLLARMPPAYDGAGAYRYPAPTVKQHIFHALRAAGFHVTPPAPAGCFFEMPGQGQVWAGAVGRVTKVQAWSAGRLQPTYTAAPWGDGMSDAVIVGVPSGPYTHVPGHTMLVSFMVGPGHAGESDIWMIHEGGTSAKIYIGQNRSVLVSVGGEVVCSLSSAQMAGATIVSVRLTYASGIELRNNTGAVATSTTNGPPGEFRQFEFTFKPGACIAGVQVSDGSVSTGHPALDFVPSARIRGGAFMEPLPATRNVRRLDARNQLGEICKATLTALWIDRAGVVQVAGSDVLHAQAPVKTYSTATDIRGLAWQSATRYARRSLSVTYSRWALEISPDYSVQVWQGDGATLIPGQEKSLPIEIPAEQLWIEVDGAVQRIDRITQGESVDDANAGIGSLYGVSVDAGGSSVPDESAASMSLSYQGEFLYLYTAKATKNCRQTISDSERLNATIRGQNLPILKGRARAEVTGEDAERREGGPSYAPELAHEMGVWGSQLTAGNIADWLKQMVFKPRPVLNGFEVPLDPALEVGQVIDVESMNLLGVKVRGLVVSRSHDVGGRVTTVSIRVIDVIANKATYADLETAWAGRDYAALETAFTGDTYAGFEDYPTKGAPNGV